MDYFCVNIGRTFKAQNEIKIHHRLTSSAYKHRRGSAHKLPDSCFLFSPRPPRNGSFQVSEDWMRWEFLFSLRKEIKNWNSFSPKWCWSMMMLHFLSKYMSRVTMTSNYSLVAVWDQVQGFFSSIAKMFRSKKVSCFSRFHFTLLVRFILNFLFRVKSVFCNWKLNMSEKEKKESLTLNRCSVDPNRFFLDFVWLSFFKIKFMKQKSSKYFLKLTQSQVRGVAEVELQNQIVCAHRLHDKFYGSESFKKVADIVSWNLFHFFWLAEYVDWWRFFRNFPSGEQNKWHFYWKLFFQCTSFLKAKLEILSFPLLLQFFLNSFGAWREPLCVPFHRLQAL